MRTTGQGDGFRVLDEIIVTAQRREKDLQSVPISMTVLSATQLASNGTNRLSMQQYLVPNLVMSMDKPSTGLVSIRGIGNSTRNIGIDLRAGAYLDGVYLARSQALDLDAHGLERVEVLRGPQGTLFGRNTVSGALNMTSEVPRDEFGGRVALIGGSYDERSFRGALDMPLYGDTLVSKVTYSRREKDGYVFNEHLRTPMNGASSESAGLKLRARPSAMLEVGWNLDWFDEDVPATFRQSIADSPNRIRHDVFETDARDSRGTMASIDYHAGGGATLTSITAYRDSGFDSHYDEDYSPQYIGRSHFNEDHRQFSQEFRLVSPVTAQWDYVLGLFFFDSSAESTREAALGPGATGGPELEVGNEGEVDAASHAAYVHGNYRIGERLELTGGARYTWEDKAIDFFQADATGLFLDFAAPFADTLRFSEWSATLGGNFRLNDETFLYASYSNGYNSGGWNADFVNSLEKLAFDTEYVDSYESGIKARLLQERLYVDFAAFYSDYRDYQVQQFSTDSRGSVIIVVSNAGHVVTRGIETAATLLLGRLSVSANAGYAQATYRRYRDANGPGLHLDGERLNGPRGSWSLALEYQLPIRAGIEASVSGQYAYRQSHGTRGARHPVDTTVPGYSLVNLQADFRFTNSGLALAVWVKNAADERYWLQHDASFLGIERVLYGEPRTGGITLSYGF